MDTFAALGRMSISLVAVLGLLWLISRWLRRSKAGKVATAGEITVLTRTAVGHKSGVAVVKVGDRALVVGVTEAAVSLLADLPLETVTGPQTVREDREVVALPAEFSAPAPTAPAAPAPVAVTATVPATRAARRAAEDGVRSPAPLEEAPTGTALAGSAISPQTWIKAVDVLRERTTRR